jgi:ribosome-binding protein aMBF1 (putative translation factor)
MKAQQARHSENSGGIQRFATAYILTLNLNVVGQNIAEFRHQRGWIREELAAKLQLLGCNITPHILANIETGHCAVTDTQIVFFSEAFRVPVKD